MRTEMQRTFAAALLAAAVTAAPAVAQEPSPGAITRAEATAFTEGWAALTKGDIAVASSIATQVVRDYPRNPSSVAFAVEVAIVSQGWRGGLDAYEQWVSGRPVEHFYALRRVARAVLFDALSTLGNIRLKLDVADALGKDGDPDVAIWVQRLAEQQAASGRTDTRTLAAAGDADAVAAIAKTLAEDPRPVDSITALGRSRNAAAVTPLISMLGHPRAEIRAAAATALGDLGASNASTQLRRMLDDQQLLPRMAAAGSLIKLGDMTAMSQVYEWFRSDVADVRLKAAEYTAVNPDATWRDHVRQLLQDPDPMVRIGAARLLGKHDPGAAMWALRALTSDENLAIREEAQRVLPEAIGGDFAELRRYMRAADDDTRVRAALRVVELTR